MTIEKLAEKLKAARRDALARLTDCTAGYKAKLIPVIAESCPRKVPGFYSNPTEYDKASTFAWEAYKAGYNDAVKEFNRMAVRHLADLLSDSNEPSGDFYSELKLPVEEKNQLSATDLMKIKKEQQ